MEKAGKGIKRILALGASVAREAWVNIALFLLAGLLIGSGVYLRSQSEWTIRTDIREYNQGVSTYQLLLWQPLVSSETLPPPRLLSTETPPSSPLVSTETPPSPPLSSSEALPAIYPHAFDKAGPHFDRAGSESIDKKVKSLALYNLGTMLGRLGLAEELPSAQQTKMAQAITKLAEAIRNDPDNEDAKYNLEFLEKMLGGQIEEGVGHGQGYASGAIDKGY